MCSSPLSFDSAPPVSVLTRPVTTTAAPAPLATAPLAAAARCALAAAARAAAVAISAAVPSPTRRFVCHCRRRDALFHDDRE